MSELNPNGGMDRRNFLSACTLTGFTVLGGIGISEVTRRIAGEFLKESYQVDELLDGALVLRKTLRENFTERPVGMNFDFVDDGRYRFEFEILHNHIENSYLGNLGSPLSIETFAEFLITKIGPETFVHEKFRDQTMGALTLSEFYERINTNILPNASVSNLKVAFDSGMGLNPKVKEALISL